MRSPKTSLYGVQLLGENNFANGLHSWVPQQNASGERPNVAEQVIHHPRPRPRAPPLEHRALSTSRIPYTPLLERKPCVLCLLLSLLLISLAIGCGDADNTKPAVEDDNADADTADSFTALAGRNCV